MESESASGWGEGGGRWYVLSVLSGKNLFNETERKKLHWILWLSIKYYITAVFPAQTLELYR